MSKPIFMFIPTVTIKIHDSEKNDLALEFVSLSLKLWLRSKFSGFKIKFGFNGCYLYREYQFITH